MGFSQNLKRLIMFLRLLGCMLGFQHSQSQMGRLGVGPLMHLCDHEAGYEGIWAPIFDGAALGFEPQTSCTLNLFISSCSGCYAFAVWPNINCHLYTTVSVVDNSSVYVKKVKFNNFSPMQSYIFSKVLEETKFYSRSKEEVLLLRQDRSAAGAFFPFFSGVWHLNKDDPDAPNYSRLDELQEYVGSDGAYHFRQAQQHIFFVAIYIVSHFQEHI